MGKTMKPQCLCGGLRFDRAAEGGEIVDTCLSCGAVFDVDSSGSIKASIEAYTNAMHAAKGGDWRALSGFSFRLPG